MSKLPGPNPVLCLRLEPGSVFFELFESEVPNTVANFVMLAEKGFYTGKIFHEIVPGKVLKGGCPLGNGTGSPGYRINDEWLGSTHKHVKHSLTLLNQGKPNTGGSQFAIITAVDGMQAFDGKHTVFGKVIRGFPVLEQLEQTRTFPDGRPLNPPRILELSVIVKRNHSYCPVIIPMKPGSPAQ